MPKSKPAGPPTVADVEAQIARLNQDIEAIRSAQVDLEARIAAAWEDDSEALETAWSRLEARLKAATLRRRQLDRDLLKAQRREFFSKVIDLRQQFQAATAEIAARQERLDELKKQYEALQMEVNQFATTRDNAGFMLANGVVSEMRQSNLFVDAEFNALRLDVMGWELPDEPPAEL